jgi:chromosome segregation ATPase
MAEKTPIGDMPRMVPDRDDIRTRHSTAPSEPKVAPKAKEPPSSGGQSWVMVTLLIVAGISIGYLALQQYSLAQLLNSYEERLELADERIVSLEQALTQTDESVAMNGTAINAQFKAIKAEAEFQMSEIRKLWDVTNKRNRVWIEENQQALKKQTDAVGALIKTVGTVEAAQKAESGTLAALQTQVADEKAKIAEFATSLESVEGDIGTVNRAIESLINSNVEERILTLTLTQENLLAEQGQITNSVSEQSTQVDDMLVTLKSIDAYRLETNRRITTLNAQLDSLETRLTALTGSTP